MIALVIFAVLHWFLRGHNGHSLRATKCGAPRDDPSQFSCPNPPSLKLKEEGQGRVRLRHSLGLQLLFTGRKAELSTGRTEESQESALIGNMGSSLSPCLFFSPPVVLGIEPRALVHAKQALFTELHPQPKALSFLS